MKKATELVLNGILNISIALIVGALFKLLFDYESFYLSLSLFIIGVYLYVFISLILFYIDKNKGT